MTAVLQFASEVLPAPPTGSSSLILWIIVAALGGTGFSQAVTWMLRRQTRDNLVSDTAKKAVEGVAELLDEYRTELDRAKRELRELRDRVAKLEGELSAANGERSRLQQLLNEAIDRRARAEEHIASLEDRIRTIEGTVERRGGRDPAQ